MILKILTLDLNGLTNKMISLKNGQHFILDLHTTINLFEWEKILENVDLAIKADPNELNGYFLKIEALQGSSKFTEAETLNIVTLETVESTGTPNQKTLTLISQRDKLQITKP